LPGWFLGECPRVHRPGPQSRIWTRPAAASSAASPRSRRSPWRRPRPQSHGRGADARLFNTHTSERLTLPYFADGDYLSGALSRLETFLRDHRTGEQHPIDPTLFDLLHELRQATSAKSPFQVISCYRSPATNAMLRADGGGVARGSLHLQGRAIDIRLGDVSSAVLRDAARELRRGGVGYYRQSDFVHVDTGRVRTW
jgi:uncharacterized protein YcbK (DUF882 family)